MAIEIFAKRVVDKTLHQLTRNMGKTWRYMVSDSQYRWIGPEKSVTHLAVDWSTECSLDLWGKVLQKPVWQIVCEMTPEEIVRCIDFRYITDVITPDEAVKMLNKLKSLRRRWITERYQLIRLPLDGWPSLVIG
jgi:L-galactonate dehydratase